MGQTTDNISCEDGDITPDKTDDKLADFKHRMAKRIESFCNENSCPISFSTYRKNLDE